MVIEIEIIHIGALAQQCIAVVLIQQKILQIEMGMGCLGQSKGNPSEAWGVMWKRSDQLTWTKWFSGGFIL